jgi:hypothetical protein
MKQGLTVGMLVATLVGLASACGGAPKPPMQPDSDMTSSLGDGGTDVPATSAQPANVAPPK